MAEGLLNRTLFSAKSEGRSRLRVFTRLCLANGTPSCKARRARLAEEPAGKPFAPSCRPPGSPAACLARGAAARHSFGMADAAGIPLSPVQKWLVAGSTRRALAADSGTPDPPALATAPPELPSEGNATSNGLRAVARLAGRPLPRPRPLNGSLLMD